MTALEKLKLLTPLQGCRTAWEHFCAISKGVGQTVYVSGEYQVQYLGEENSVVYQSPELFDVEYTGQSEINIEYQSTGIEVRYLEEPLMSVTWNCKK